MMPKKAISRDRILTPSSMSLSDTAVASQADSDYALDESSDTPVEDFGEDATDQEWPVVGVVKQEIDINHKPRYQIRWGKWKRPDGSDTTWEKALEGNSEVIARYMKEELKRRKALSTVSDTIDLQVLGSVLPHNRHTAEARVAYKEKLTKNKKFKSTCDWNDEVRKNREEALPSSTHPGPSTKKRKFDEVQTPVAGPSRIRDLCNLGDPMDTSPDEDVQGTRDTLRRHAIRVERKPTTIPSLNQLMRHTSEEFSLKSLQTRWNRAAQNYGAAAITIVNEEDSSTPTIESGFVYREASFIYGTGVPKPSDVQEFLTGCDCKKNCKSYHICTCQRHFIEEEESEGPCRAYEDSGLFLFSTQFVTECYKMCSCDFRCLNRVLQKPRSIPMEIFKTRKNGWGVRSPVDIARGKVLGFYTGHIIQREDAEKIDMEKRVINVVFDLDLYDDVEHVRGRYSVDATNTGNWTRFVNHSCEPNTDIVSIFVDYPMESNIPRLGFIANTFIPAMTELTISYSGNLNLQDKESKKKKKGRVKCLCGSANCQGYVF